MDAIFISGEQTSATEGTISLFCLSVKASGPAHFSSVERPSSPRSRFSPCRLRPSWEEGSIPARRRWCRRHSAVRSRGKWPRRTHSSPWRWSSHTEAPKKSSETVEGRGGKKETCFYSNEPVTMATYAELITLLGRRRVQINSMLTVRRTLFIRTVLIHNEKRESQRWWRERCNYSTWTVRLLSGEYEALSQGGMWNQLNASGNLRFRTLISCVDEKSTKANFSKQN